MRSVLFLGLLLAAAPLAANYNLYERNLATRRCGCCPGQGCCRPPYHYYDPYSPNFMPPYYPGPF